MRSRRGRVPRTTGVALAVALGLGLAREVRAQGPPPRAAAELSVDAGAVFPSGGDLNDTYAPGAYVASALSVGVVRRVALRVDARWASFAPSPAPKHVERDSRIGYAGALSLGAVGTVVPHRDRAALYAILSGGRERVGSTWLNANNVVEPFSRAELWSWGLGIGSEVTSRIGVEVQRLTAHRGSRGVVGYIPIGIRVRF